MALWPVPLPRWYWQWQAWVDDDRYGPRPADAPRLIPPWAWARYLLHRGQAPKPQTPASLFSHLGGFISQAGSFPPDTESAKAFRAAGGCWLAVQFGDPATDQGNRARFAEGWAERWRLLGVQVGAWWRVEHVGIPVPRTPPVDFLVPNPEQPHEIERLPGILVACVERLPSAPLAVITLGKVPGFPTGLLEWHDAHLIPECFLETAASDTTVTNSVRYWLDSQVARARIHPCCLFKPGDDRYPIGAAAAEARALGVCGLSAFTSENCPPTAWSVMA